MKKFKKAMLTMLIGSAAPLWLSKPVWGQPEEEFEEIVVTGSRIPQSGVSQAAPVFSIDASVISNAATPDIASILAELPAIGSTNTLVGNNDSNADAGISSADLRRLGAQRTLVLVDGIRHVAGAPGTAQVDLSTIPAILVERTEILTGGASAVYGSDAVSGVINIITRNNFEGFEFRASGAAATEVDTDSNYSLDFLAGKNLFDGRANLMLYFGYNEVSQVMSRDLQHLDNWGTVANPADTGEEDGIPDRFWVPRVLSHRINSTGVANPFGGSGEVYTFDNDGNLLVQQSPELINSAAFGSFPNGCDYCFGNEEYENWLPGVERFNLQTKASYDFSESLQFYSELKYMSADIVQQFQPSFRFGGISINVADNPYLSDSARQTLLATLGDGESTVEMSKFFDELGNRSAANDRASYRFVTGLNGRFELADTEYSYNIFYNYGRTENQRLTLNDLIPGNFTAAVDAVNNNGNIDCRANVASLQPEGYESPATVDADNCVPYNLFGFGQLSQEARDWVTADVRRDDTISQSNFGASVVFDTGSYFTLPGGPVGVALGVEYRRETSKTLTDELTKSGVLLGAATPDASGEFDVSEGFVEFKLPILAEAAMAHELTVDLAYRAADYDPFGSVDAAKFSLLWAPVADIKLRATYGEAVRAPNIGEAFSPQSPGFANIADPCDADSINDDPDRVANCAALGLSVGFEANDNMSIDTISSGNPDLTPETSTSTTGGIVYVPAFLEGFSLTLDYYSIEIEDAILEVEAQDILDNCVDATGGLDDLFCSSIDRDPETGDVDLVRSGFVNASIIEAEGIELDMRYLFDLDSFGAPGSLDIRLFVNHVLDLNVFEFQSRPDEINVDVGEVGDPEWQALFSSTYLLGDLTLRYAARFIDRSATIDVSPGADIPEDQSPAFIESVTTHDISAAYAFNNKTSLLFGVRNFTNKLPPPRTVDAIYDSIGRRMFAELKYQF
ncbi:MAG: TonB-dependent receptor [Cellvibrionaceae bacterium]|nr:TonB-dependent receptor [Cellvibrionaceae bacterium]